MSLIIPMVILILVMSACVSGLSEAELANKDGAALLEQGLKSKRASQARPSAGLTTIERYNFEVGIMASGKSSRVFMEGAIEAFTKAIQLDPDYARAYKKRGYTYNQLGQYMDAIPDLNKAIELNPDDSNAYNNRGIAYKNGLNFWAAIQDYDKAIQLDPDNGHAYHNRCNIYRRYLHDEAKWKSDRAKAKSLGVGGC